MKYTQELCPIVRKEQLNQTTFRFTVASREAVRSMKPGQFANILAPLGNGFDIRPDEIAVFVGGGIGVPPLLGASAPCGGNATALLGFRNRDAMILADDFRANGADVRVATDDGSFGHHGFVTQLLAQRLDEAPCDAVYACGPKPMLRLTAAEAEKRGIRCMVSLEERMGCGVGACLVCACKTKTPDGGEKYLHVCKNGPVFDSREVIWE